MFPFLDPRISQSEQGQDRDEVTGHREQRKKGPGSALGRNWPSLVTAPRLVPMPAPEPRPTPTRDFLSVQRAAPAGPFPHYFCFCHK